jgi:predicted negative regulator of RcsB-dependent stress response
MKTERRTELKSNLLADRVEAIALAVKPHLKTAGIVAGLLMVIAIGFGLSRWQREKSAATAWAEYYFSSNRPDTLRDVFETHPDQAAGLWARQVTGDSMLAQALGQIYIDRDSADKILLEAADHYRTVMEKANDDLLLSRATLGLAQVLESQGKGEDALREYKKLLSMKGVNSEMRLDVQRRIEFLQSPDGSKFLDWFAKNRTGSSRSVQVPADIKSLPDKPDLNFSNPPMAIPTEQPPTSEPTASNPASTNGESLALPQAEVIEKPSTRPADATPSLPPTLKPPQSEPKGSGS